MSTDVHILYAQANLIDEMKVSNAMTLRANCLLGLYNQEIRVVDAFLGPTLGPTWNEQEVTLVTTP